jgi:hypothetical protein
LTGTKQAKTDGHKRSATFRKMYPVEHHSLGSTGIKICSQGNRIDIKSGVLENGESPELLHRPSVQQQIKPPGCCFGYRTGLSAATGNYLCWDILVRDEVFTENKIGRESFGG